MNRTGNVLLMALKMKIYLLFNMSKYMIFWWTYTLNIDNRVGIIMVGPLGTAVEIIIVISERNDLGSLNKTDNMLLVYLKMSTLWTIQCESISDIIVDLYFEFRNSCRNDNSHNKW